MLAGQLILGRIKAKLEEKEWERSSEQEKKTLAQQRFENLKAGAAIQFMVIMGVLVVTVINALVPNTAEDSTNLRNMFSGACVFTTTILGTATACMVLLSQETRRARHYKVASWKEEDIWLLAAYLMIWAADVLFLGQKNFVLLMAVGVISVSTIFGLRVIVRYRQKAS